MAVLWLVWEKLIFKVGGAKNCCSGLQGTHLDFVLVRPCQLDHFIDLSTAYFQGHWTSRDQKIRTVLRLV